MSQTEFGKYLGCGQSAQSQQTRVSQWERGMRPPQGKIDALNQLAKDRGLLWHIEVGLFSSPQEYEDYCEIAEIEPN